MAQYTMTLKQLLENNVDIFDIEYPFYNDECKKQFENKFIRHYFFHEIGFETVGRFIFELQSKLNEIMPYYNHLYKTTLYEYDPILNYNVDEEITINTNIDEDTSFNSSDNSSNYDTPITRSNDYKSTPSFITDNETDNVGTRNSNSQQVNKRNTKGNIGVMTTQDLINKEREIIINIDKEILLECKELFMLVW